MKKSVLFLAAFLCCNSALANPTVDSIFYKDVGTDKDSQIEAAGYHDCVLQHLKEDDYYSPNRPGTPGQQLAGQCFIEAAGWISACLQFHKDWSKYSCTFEAERIARVVRMNLTGMDY